MNEFGRYRFPAVGLALAVCVLYLAIVLPLSSRFPPVNSDEVVRADMGLQKFHGGGSRYTLFDDVFSRSVYNMRDVLPDSSLAIYHTWLGAWMNHPASSFRAARGSSIAAGVLALLMFYGLGKRLGGMKTALACMVLAGFNPLFLTASCIARPETLLLFTSTGLLWLMLALPERMELKPFLIGCLAIAQMSIHPNAFVMGVGFFVFYLYGVPRNARFLKGLLFSAGGLAGLLFALTLVDIPRLWLGLHTVHSYLLRPPIFIWPWNPLNWLIQTAQVMWLGTTHYFNPALAPGWPISLQVWWAALAISAVLAGLQFRQQPAHFEFRRWVGASLGVILSMLFLVKAKEFLYGTNLLPFLIPIAASAMTGLRRPSLRVWQILSWALAGLSLCLFLNFCRLYAARAKHFPQITAELRAMLPSGPLKLLSPNVLWFDWNKDQFRDIGAIVFSRWYMNGQINMRDSLGTWRPDIVILDTGIQQVIRQSTHKNLAQNLQCPVDLLGVLDTQGAYGPWEIYRIHWPS